MSTDRWTEIITRLRQADRGQLSETGRKTAAEGRIAAAADYLGRFAEADEAGDHHALLEKYAGGPHG